MKVALLLVAIALAGCSAPEAAPIDDVEVQEAPTPALFGLVLDHDGARVAGAVVGIDELALAQITDVNGSFAFDLEPGNYLVTVNKDGHRGAAAAIQVIEGLSAHAVFTLPTWESLPADIAIMEHRGFLECSVSSPASGPDCPTDSGGGTDSFVVDLTFTNDPIRDLLIEVFWDAVTASNEQLSAILVAPDGQWIAQAAGTSPLRMHLSEEAIGGRDRFTVDVTVDAGDGQAGYAVAQKYEAFTSVFLNKGADEGYSIHS